MNIKRENFIEYLDEIREIVNGVDTDVSTEDLWGAMLGIEMAIDAYQREAMKNERS